MVGEREGGDPCGDLDPGVQGEAFQPNLIDAARCFYYGGVPVRKASPSRLEFSLSDVEGLQLRVRRKAGLRGFCCNRSREIQSLLKLVHRTWWEQ